jgi:hypothetical protein
MTPVLRVIIPAASLTEATKTLGGTADNIITRGLNVDYNVDDPNGNKAVPVGALYAARMNAAGQVTVVVPKSALLTADHTFDGWPAPA